MRKTYVVLALASVISLMTPAWAGAGDMSVATFLEKAERLQKKGPLALLSKDLKLLQAEMKGTAQSYRAKVVADKKAGLVPHSCPPAEARMNSDELLAHLRSYPVQARSKTTISTAFADLMKKRYPCK